MRFHAVVWLDYRLAKIIGFDMHDADRAVQTVHGHSDPRIHHKAGVMGSGHAHSDPAFFKAIADDLRDFSPPEFIDALFEDGVESAAS